MKEIQTILYYTFISLLSISLIILITILIIICRKKPIHHHHQQHQPIKTPAKQYTLTDIETATDTFNPRRIISQDKLGTLYAAVLDQHDLLAVKRIHSRFVLANVKFSDTIKSLSLAHHPNVVSILGYSQAPGERIILREFNGMVSLEYYLRDGVPLLLDWNQRLKIVSGAAKGLEYLHTMVPGVVHGGFTCESVLVDEAFCGRVCDYGLWFLGGEVGREGDVYGFGVVLLEVLSGRRCGDDDGVKWGLLSLIKEMKISEVLDKRVKAPCDVKPLVRLAKVALACVANSTKDRPSMVQVATILTNLVID